MARAAIFRFVDTATNTVTKKVKGTGGPWGIQIVSKGIINAETFGDRRSLLAPGPVRAGIIPGQSPRWIVFANFTVKHMVFSTERGSMGGMKGTVIYDPKDPSKDSVEATLDVSTFQTTTHEAGRPVRTDFSSPEISGYHFSQPR